MIEEVISRGRYITSVVIMVSMVAIVLLHPVVIHEHGGTHDAGPSWAAVHTGLVARDQDVLVALPLFFVICFFAIVELRFLHAIHQRGLQDVDIPNLLPLRHLFSRGTLHSRLHG